MSQYTKRKHVSKEIEEFEFDDLPTDKSIVKIIGGKGNNLHLVQTDNGEEYLVSMPTKFRKHVWVKRGDFVLVEPIEEGDKVKAEISHVLLKPHIKQLKKEGKWPKIFDEDDDSTKEKKIVNTKIIDDNLEETEDNDYSSESEVSSLEGNPNHDNEEEEEEEESEDEEDSDYSESEDDEQKQNDLNLKDDKSI